MIFRRFKRIKGLSQSPYLFLYILSNRGVPFLGFQEKTGLNGNGPKTHQIAILRPLLACNRGGVTRQKWSQNFDLSSGRPQIGVFYKYPESPPFARGNSRETRLPRSCPRWDFGFIWLIWAQKRWNQARTGPQTTQMAHFIQALTFHFSCISQKNSGIRP